MFLDIMSPQNVRIIDSLLLPQGISETRLLFFQLPEDLDANKKARQSCTARPTESETQLRFLKLNEPYSAAATKCVYYHPYFSSRFRGVRPGPIKAL